MSDAATWVGSIGSIAAIIAAILVAMMQIRIQRRQAAVERTIAAHRDITTGEVGAARDRLSEFMWSAGSDAQANRCRQPTWEQLLGRQYVSLSSEDQDLSEYPDETAAGIGNTPLRDLYRIWWSLERIGVAHRSNILDRQLTRDMLANHVVWWDTLCEKIPANKTRYRRALKDLADEFRVESPELSAWARADFREV